MSTIRITQLSKRFGQLLAVNNIDLSVAAGEVLCLLGPSGCGKTTTLRMIAGLESATSGDIFLADERVNHLKARQRNVAMAFQFYALYPSLTVAENLAYPLYAENKAGKQIGEQVKRIAQTLDLTAILERRPGQLGEGEKQRVAVGRAIIRDPSCFLFDEPLSRLDIELRQIMRGQIKEVLAGLSKATVIVTHDQLEALTMADRIAVMRDGLIEQVATAHNIFARPKNIFVAGFIGTPQMNLLPASYVDSHGGKSRFRISKQTVAFDLGPGVRRLAPDSTVTLGIRPRAFEIAAQPSDDTVSAITDIIEPMGAETLVHMLDGENDMRVVLRRGVPVEIGRQVHLRFNPEQVHVFDAIGELVEQSSH